MTILTLSQVAKKFKLNRSSIYRAVNSGRLSRRTDGSFDLAEVIRCFGEPSTEKVVRTDPSTLVDLNAELERVQLEFFEYKRKTEEREDWLKNQIDRMQTLLEMKSQTVANATSQQQQSETQRNTDDTTSETIANNDIEQDATLHATLQKHQVGRLGDVTSVAVQQPPKRRSLLGRIVKAVLD